MRGKYVVMSGVFTWVMVALSPALLLSQAHAPDSRDQDLLTGCIGGRLAEVQSLVEQGANPNATDTYGGHPLENAAVYGYMEIAEFLLDHGADPNGRDQQGETPLYAALINDRTGIAD